MVRLNPNFGTLTDVCIFSGLTRGSLTLQDNLDRIPIENVLALTQPLKIGESPRSGSAEADGFIAVIESRTFVGQCIRRSMQSAFPLPVLTYSTAIELEKQHLLTSAHLIIFSWVEGSKEGSIDALKVLSELAPKIPPLSSLTSMTPSWPGPPFAMAQKVTSQ